MMRLILGLALLGCGADEQEKPQPPRDSTDPGVREDLATWIEQTWPDDPELHALLLRVAEDMDDIVNTRRRSGRHPGYADVAALQRHSGGAAVEQYAELRARVLYNLERSEAWERFMAAESGALLEDLGSLCGLAPPSGGGSACPDERALEVFFVNGVNNDPFDAVIGACTLFSRTAEAHAACCPERELRYTLAYNQTRGLLPDLLEFFVQRGAFAGVLSEILRFVGLVTPDPLEEWVAELVDALAGAIASLDPFAASETAALAERFDQALSAGDRVLVYAHSQGNLFVNAAWQRMGQPAREDFSVIAIASPADEVAAGTASDHVTLEGDRVIAAVDLLLGAMDANVEDSDGQDFLHHGLVTSYLGVSSCNAACEAILALTQAQLGVAEDAGLCGVTSVELGRSAGRSVTALNHLDDAHTDLVGYAYGGRGLQVLAGADGPPSSIASLEFGLSAEFTSPYESCSVDSQAGADADANGYADLLIEVSCTSDELDFSGAEDHELYDSCGCVNPPRECLCYRLAWFRLPGGQRGVIDESQAWARYEYPSAAFQGVNYSLSGARVFDLLGDFDGDGTAELLVSGSGATALPVDFTGVLDSTVEEYPSVALSTGGDPGRGDLDGDGLVEIFGLERVLLGGEGSSVADADAIALEGLFPVGSTDYTQNDLNGDGAADLLLLERDVLPGRARVVAVFGETPTPTELSWEDADLVIEREGFNLTAVGDTTGDGAADIVFYLEDYVDYLPTDAATLWLFSGGGGGGTLEIRGEEVEGLERINVSGFCSPDTAWAALTPRVDPVGDVTGGPTADLLVRMEGLCYPEADNNYNGAPPTSATLFFLP